MQFILARVSNPRPSNCRARHRPLGHECSVVIALWGHLDTFRKPFFQDIIEFDASGLPIFTDPKYFRDYGWKLSGTVPQALEDPAQVAQMGFCINLQRASSSVRIELTVPLMVTAILFLVTPFLAQIKLQVCLYLSSPLVHPDFFQNLRLGTPVLDLPDVQ